MRIVADAERQFDTLIQVWKDTLGSVYFAGLRTDIEEEPETIEALRGTDQFSGLRFSPITDRLTSKLGGKPREPSKR